MASALLCTRAMPLPLLSSSLLALLIFVASPAAAGLGRWTPVGPEGADTVSSLAIDPLTPTTLYAWADGAGIFKSTDGGATWQSKSRGLEGSPYASHILVDPQNPSILYASHLNSKSIDGGETWFRNAPLVGSLGPSALDPQNPSTVYAVETYYGAFKSTDGGASWQQIALDIGIVASVVVDPHSSATLYAFIEEGGVFKSTDGGATWTAIDDALPARSIAMLAFDPVTPGTIYLAAFPEYDRDFNRLADGGVFKSTDGGTTWTTGVQLNNGGVAKVVVNPQDTAIVYALTYPLGVFQSTDGGTTWSERGPLPEDMRVAGAFLIDPLTPTTLYLATDLGILKSVDAGATWNAINAGLTQIEVTALGVTSDETPTIYVGTARKGLFTSPDRGATWRAVDDFGPVVPYWGISIDAVAVDPLTPSTVYALVDGGNPRGPVRSIDDGASWAIYPFDPFGRSEYCVQTLAVDPLDPGIVYAGRSFGGVCEGGVLRSVDGEPWTPTGAPAIRVTALAVDPIDPGTLYIGGDYRGGFYWSTDGGGSWTESPDLPFATVAAIAVDPLHPGVVHAAVDEGIRTSTDGGRHWGPVSLPYSRVSAILIDPRDSDVVYAGAWSGVYRSVDRGATWARLGDGLVDATVGALALDPENPSELYAGTRGSSAYRIDLGAACTASAECDDGDACTADACEASATDGARRCVQRPLSGLDGVSCGFDVAGAGGPCASERMHARFERVLARGHARLARAAADGSSARTIRALTAAAQMAYRAGDLADAATRRGRIGTTCGATLVDAFQAAASRALRHAHQLRSN